MKLALFSAFPQETAVIIKRMKARKVASSPFSIFSARAASKEIVIVECGMGYHNSEAAWNHVIEEYRPDCIVSAGYCGAFLDGAQIGDVIVASRVFLYPDIAETTSTGRNQNCLVEIRGAKELISKMASALPVHEGSILTLRKRLKKTQVAEKLLEGLPFPVCDMETFPLAKLSIQEEMPFFAIRAVTDRAHEEIPPELFNVTHASGNYSFSRAVRVILGKPSLISSCITIGKNAWVASRKLCRATEELMHIL